MPDNVSPPASPGASLSACCDVHRSTASTRPSSPIAAGSVDIDHERLGLSDTPADANETDSTPAKSKFGDGSHDQARGRCAGRVSDGNRPPIDVRDFSQALCLRAIARSKDDGRDQGNRGEGLVDLEDMNIAKCESCPPQGELAGYRGHRCDVLRVPRGG